MSGLEIGLLALGAIIFIGSFFIQEKLSSSDVDEIKKLSEKEVKIILEKQLNEADAQIKTKIYNRLDESFAEMERRSDRETNEKIMAIGEYSDNIISKMDKTHEEIMFMYDMLNDKQEKITQLTRDAQDYESHLRGITEEMAGAYAQNPAQGGVPVYEQPAYDQQYANQQYYDQQAYAQQMPAGAEYYQQPGEQVQYDEQAYAAAGYAPEEAAYYDEAAAMQQEAAPEEVPEQQEVAPPPISLNLAAESEDDNEARVLSMFRQGYTQVEIAKKTGVSLGEIRLMLRLYGGEDEA